MATDPFKIIEAAFEQASILSEDERAAFIAQFREEHPDLMDQLQRLLAADGESDHSFSDPIEASIKAATQDREDHWRGRQLGVWKLSERLGAGGMGAVFLASRTGDEFEQTAAVKIMGSQLLNANAASRFRSERQILSNLNHPNIASLIDGGTTEDGLPYLVMEYIDGDRVDAYCDTQGLTVRERLALFTKICGAIDYAHRNLVVHRDLKPSNILVPDNGEPKLLDFGIAKLLDPDALETTAAQTGQNARAMTPEYASPEQVRGETVSVASDVYALGVLLFRLLTGHSPYDSSLTTQREIESAILESDPKRPSDAVSRTQNSETSLRISRQQSGLPIEQLRRRLAGDLDNIVLKCLQKDPERRYANARELSADIDRYLTGRTVMARGDAWTYKAKKFLTRNWKPVAASVAVATTIISVITYYTVQLADERDRAQLAASRSDQIARFLENAFESANPAAAPGETVTAEMLLESGVQDIEEIQDPMVKGALLRSMGTSYAELGAHAQAKSILDRSVAVFRTQGTSARLDLAHSLDALADVRHQTDHLSDALRDQTEAVELVRATLGNESQALPPFLSGLATIHARLQDPQEAVDLWQEALALQRIGGTFGDALTSDILGDLATSYDNQGDYQRAIDTGEMALELSEKNLGRLDPNTIVIISNLGLVSYRMGRYDQAAEYGAEAIARGETLWPEGHWRLSFFRIVTATYLRNLGDIEGAEAYLDQAETDILRIEGEDSANYNGLLYSMGSHSNALKDSLQARDHHLTGLARARSVFGETGEMTIRHQIGLARAFTDLGEIDRAEELLNAATENRNFLRRANQLELDMQLARLLTAQNKYAEANQRLSDALANKQREAGPQSPALLPYLKAATQLSLAAEDPEQALLFSTRAIEIARDHLPDKNWIAALAQVDWGSALIATGKTSEGQAAIRSALQDLAAVFPADHPHIKATSDLLQTTDAR